MRLYINSTLADINTSAIVTQTKQANTFFSLDTRQANYTNTFTLLPTDNNRKIFEGLGYSGNTSNLPYMHVRGDLYGDDGECYVYDGRVLINEFSDAGGYSISIFDGSINIYKDIEGDTLGMLNIEDIRHEKTVTNIVDSWNNNTLNYRYLVADYNGKLMTDDGKLNADYLTPSVNVGYLWDKIFEFYGYEYEGSTFSSEDFKNLWLSYPRGVLSTIPDVLKYKSETFSIIDNQVNDIPPILRKQSAYVRVLSAAENDGVTVIDNKHFRVPESGNYRIKITGQIRTWRWVDFSGSTGAIRFPAYCSLNMAKNAVAFPNAESIESVAVLQNDIRTYSGWSGYEDINVDKVVYVDENEPISFFVRAISGHWISYNDAAPMTVTISKVEYSDIDFSDAFLDMSTKDFFNEILYRFALTPYTEKYSKKIRFLTLSEVIQGGDFVDLSGMYVRSIGEKYIHDGYCQKNRFKYKYNIQGEEFNDSYIQVNNTNLDAEKVSIESKTYSPENSRIDVFGANLWVFKMFEKNVRGDEIEYKQLDKRFYFMRSSDFLLESPKYVKSEILNTELHVTHFLTADFSRLDFNYVVQNPYRLIKNIIDKSKIKTVDMNLTSNFVENVDMSKMCYIDKLGGYFLINQISAYNPKKPITRVDLVKVDYSVPVVLENRIINSIFVHRVEGDSTIHAYLDIMLNSSFIVDVVNNNVQNVETKVDGQSAFCRYFGNGHFLRVLRVISPGEHELVLNSLPGFTYLDSETFNFNNI